MAAPINPGTPCSDPSFWEPHPIAPIAALAELRAHVLRRSTKRCPKWKFRLAPDLIVQLQPRPVCLLFGWPAKAQGRPQRILGFDGRGVPRAGVDTRDDCARSAQRRVGSEF